LTRELALFRFEREQKIFRIGLVEVGGQPGNKKRS